MSVIAGQKPKAQVPFYLQVFAVIACSWLVASVMVYYVVAKDAAEIAANLEINSGEPSPLLGSININEAVVEKPVENLQAPIARGTDKPAPIGRGLQETDPMTEILPETSTDVSNVIIQPSVPDPNEPSSLFAYDDEIPVEPLFEAEPLIEEIIVPENNEHENVCVAGDIRTDDAGAEEFCVDGLWSASAAEESRPSSGPSSGGSGGSVAPAVEPALEANPIPVCNDGDTGLDSYGEDAVCYGGQWVANLEVDISSSTESFSPSAGELITIESTTNTSALTGVTIFPVLPDSTNTTDMALVEYLSKSNPSESETLAIAQALIDGLGSSPAFQHKHTHELVRDHVEIDVWTGELPYGGGVVPGQYVIVFYAQNYNMTGQTLAIIETITVSE